MYSIVPMKLLVRALSSPMLLCEQSGGAKRCAGLHWDLLKLTLPHALHHSQQLLSTTEQEVAGVTLASLQLQTTVEQAQGRE